MANRKLIDQLRKQGRVRDQRRVVNLPQQWRLPFPPSVNALYATVRDNDTGVMKRTLSANGRKIKRQIIRAVDGRLEDPGKLVLDLEFFLSCYTKKGTVRRVDLSNRVKLIEDAISEALGYDDSLHWHIRLQKRDTDGHPYVVARLTAFQG